MIVSLLRDHQVSQHSALLKKRKRSFVMSSSFELIPQISLVQLLLLVILPLLSLSEYTKHPNQSAGSKVLGLYCSFI